MTISDTLKKIGITKDYSSMKRDDLQLDLQGWGSQHAIFKQVIQETKPKLVIEVGTWKGGSLIHMSQICKEMGLDTEFICVDTWLGSNDTLWLAPKFREQLMIQHGYPSMFRQFAHNIIESGISDIVYPLPMTSTAAANVMAKLGIKADLIYIDAGHEENEVSVDLHAYYPLLNEGGIMFGDDYSMRWSGVIRAVNRFCADHTLPLYCQGNKWRFAKKAEQAAA